MTHAVITSLSLWHVVLSCSFTLVSYNWVTKQWIIISRCRGITVNGVPPAFSKKNESSDGSSKQSVIPSEYTCISTITRRLSKASMRCGSHQDDESTSSIKMILFKSHHLLVLHFIQQSLFIVVRQSALSQLNFVNVKIENFHVHENVQFLITLPDLISQIQQLIIITRFFN